METNRVQSAEICLRLEFRSVPYKIACFQSDKEAIRMPCNLYRIFYHLYNCNTKADKHYIYLGPLFFLGRIDI